MAYLDGELTPQQRQVFEEHLAVCASCVNYLQSYQSAIRLGKAAMKNEQFAPEPVPAGLIEAIRAARSR